jgi:Transglutaminase-like superfamily
MQESSLDHFRSFSRFTYPGLYQEFLRRDLPGDIAEMGRLVKQQVIHTIVLSMSREGSHVNPAYGKISEVPWYRQAEDDYFPTAAAMLAELYHRDPRGFVSDRSPANKLIVTCRFVAILVASILKSRGIPARVRAGYAPYIPSDHIEDHWITQYWHAPEERWVTIDADGSLEQFSFDTFDMPSGTFTFGADAWLSVRAGRQDPDAYRIHGPTALDELAAQVFADFHCLMNNEIPYTQYPVFVVSDFDETNEQKLQAADAFARLMQQPDENFSQLQTIWEDNRDFRLLRGSLI